MGPWLLLLVLALIAFVIGFGTAAHWLFVVGIVLLVVGLLLNFTTGRSRV